MHKRVNIDDGEDVDDPPSNEHEVAFVGSDADSDDAYAAASAKRRKRKGKAGPLSAVKSSQPRSDKPAPPDCFSRVIKHNVR